MGGSGNGGVNTTDDWSMKWIEWQQMFKATPFFFSFFLLFIFRLVAIESGGCNRPKMKKNKKTSQDETTRFVVVTLPIFLCTVPLQPNNMCDFDTLCSTYRRAQNGWSVQAIAYFSNPIFFYSEGHCNIGLYVCFFPLTLGEACGLSVVSLKTWASKQIKLREKKKRETEHISQ